ncbi:MAG: diadenylate cyclase CdaA [Prevotellaceae bacterium]|jgi:uncharacterized protein (TIGR00159 family)|nr:diadenylate cyclase CdaA [Prevotellaceae bacterium]
MLDFIHFNLSDILDIVAVAFLLYQVYKIIRGTAAINIFTGILLLYFLWFIVRALNMQLLSTILGQVLGVGIIALIIVFQQEIRRFLLHLGSRFNNQRYAWLQRLFKQRMHAAAIELDIDSITHACQRMSESRTGALMVIERHSVTKIYAETGDIIDARISSRLLQNLFFKNAPLHDGAVIISRNRIYAARCTLPISEQVYIPAQYGMRHRAAVGLSERTDAIVIVVSEETGVISIVENAVINRMDGGAGELRKKLEEMLQNNH